MGVAPVRADGAQAAELLAVAPSEMTELVLAHDWSSTALGPISTWPLSLLTTVRLVLASRYPMFVWWGPDLVNIYNDSYIPVLGAKHPAALGASGREVWAEVWGDLGGYARAVVEEGRSNWAEDMPLFMERHGYREETYFTFSYSPIHDDTGAIGGLFCACSEETERVLGQRRLHTLSRLTNVGAGSETSAIASALDQLDPRDHPFALVYLTQGDSAVLAGQRGLDGVEGVAPERIDVVGGATAIWPLARLEDGVAVTVIDDVAVPLPGGPWPEPATAVAILPIDQPWRRTGYLVTGLSPRRAFDAGYQEYLALVASSLGCVIGHARSVAGERRRAEQLVELDHAKTAFFSNVSHEFRTPLTLLLGPVDDLLAKALREGDDERRDRLDLIRRNALRLLRMVDSLLDFSRIEAGRIHADYRPVDAAALTADLASTFRSACERVGLELTVDCPPLGQPVYLDRDMWEKIVLNLLSNAFKHTLTGWIRVGLVSDGDAIELTVADSGVGIPPEEHGRVFERFHRIPGSRGRTHEGTGIGLALIRELARLHGGSVSLRSALDRGSAFTVRVPLGRDHLPADQVSDDDGGVADVVVEEVLRWLPAEAGLAEEPDERLGERPCPPYRVGPALKRILVVDDNADMRSYLRRLLGSRWQVEAAVDGEDALERIRSQRPDLVISDVMMPQLDGFGLLRAIREDPDLRQLPVILLSARADEPASTEGLESGADDYLIKPFSGRELFARVTSQLRLHQLRRQLLEQEEQLTDHLRRANAELESFAATVAHDLLSPLRMIAMHLDLLGQDHRDSLEAGAHRHLDKAIASTERMRSLILALLELCHSGRRSGAADPPVDLREVIGLATANLEQELQETGSQVTVEDELARVVCDRDLLVQVFQNLIGNAVRYRHPERRPRVTIRAGATEDGACRVSVEDNGIGIAPENHERIFVAFKRLGAAGHQDGFGIGLSLCQRVIESRGGRIWVESRLGEGSTFHFTLPCA